MIGGYGTEGAPSVGLPGGRPVHETVLAVARSAPATTALVYGSSRTTYADLAARVEALAARLTAGDVGPERRVGVCLRRGPALPVAFLAALRSGGVYVPLDPDYPRDRLEYMLEDARPEVVLVDGDTADAVLGLSVPLLRVDVPPPEPVPAAPWPELHPEHLAYLIYTSGSTGRPKGAAIPHRSLATMAAAQRAALGVGPGDRVLQWGSPGFDASVFDMVLALASGAELHTSSTDELTPGPALGALLARSRISVLTIMPSSLAALPVVAAPDLRLLVVAGEALPTGTIERWATGRRMVNVYGTTETGIWDTAGDVVPGETGAGRELPGSSVRIVDAALDLVPDGTVGEIVLAGPGAARGYLGRPGRTAAAWVPDPAGPPGSRRYLTGDLGRLRADGTLEVLGRTDDQVKVRGFRVELGEVDAALGRHPDVAEHAVVAVSSDDTPRLLGYATVVPAARAGGPDLLDHLRSQLPSHMVPAAVVVLDHLPLTPHGKLDRAALPVPRAGGGGVRTEAEGLVAEIWGEVLGESGIGPEDDFFVLGGDSIRAAQVAARIDRRAGVRLPLSVLLEARTPALLGHRIEEVLEEQLAAMSTEDRHALDGDAGGEERS